jgi:hypothetical protein
MLPPTPDNMKLVRTLLAPHVPNAQLPPAPHVFDFIDCRGPEEQSGLIMCNNRSPRPGKSGPASGAEGPIWLTHHFIHVAVLPAIHGAHLPPRPMRLLYNCLGTKLYSACIAWPLRRCDVSTTRCYIDTSRTSSSGVYLSVQHRESNG